MGRHFFFEGGQAPSTLSLIFSPSRAAFLCRRSSFLVPYESPWCVFRIVKGCLPFLEECVLAYFFSVAPYLAGGHKGLFRLPGTAPFAFVDEPSGVFSPSPPPKPELIGKLFHPAVHNLLKRYSAGSCRHPQFYKWGHHRALPLLFLFFGRLCAR